MKIAVIARAVFASVLLGCTPAKPRIICVMQNPDTGTRVEMYKEIAAKVPADYDQAKHIAQWKAEQVAKGFTVEITKP